jgi:hypothetical protein
MHRASGPAPGRRGITVLALVLLILLVIVVVVILARVLQHAPA